MREKIKGRMKGEVEKRKELEKRREENRGGERKTDRQTYTLFCLPYLHCQHNIPAYLFLKLHKNLIVLFTLKSGAIESAIVTVR